MRRRICLAVGLVALTVPASSWAQSSSQAQYQGVAPETQIPVTGGGGGGTAGGGGAVTGTGGGSTATGGGSTATGDGRPASGGGTNATTGDGGVPTTTKHAAKLSLPSASSSTSPFGGGDILWIVLAVAGLVALGLLLRRGTGHTPSGA